MAKASSDTVQTVKDYGPVEDRFSELDGFTFTFLTVREASDMTPILASLPGGHCTCPHWGYVLEGRVVVRYEDREEVINAGDAYYMTPGHVPAIDAGTRLVMISPTDELAATEAAVNAAMQTTS